MASTPAVVALADAVAAATDAKADVLADAAVATALQAFVTECAGPPLGVPPGLRLRPGVCAEPKVAGRAVLRTQRRARLPATCRQSAKSS